ncbi:hypothetical protein HHJ69_03150 [Mobiluncus curtisii]|uniref:DUF5979 domain-containing protein n=1 Tax=Mobiluncus curtisii TaxID=2051 RepID=UPI0014703C3D|nr:DUF5979 domain-containing protein [Mobiluncus curtisii]NMW47083.1 hypothetical protein [Mobiluncus curtisii]
MINRVIVQKALAIIATFALLIGTVQLVSMMVRPTPADASTNTQNIPPDYGPLGDAENDPWTTNFPRPDNVEHAPELTNNRVALVFNFEPSYAWETMGGAYFSYKDGKPYRNFDQSNQIIQMLSHLRGAPVSVGVYTFHRARSANGVSPNNTPNLKATSLENKDGFDKVVAKLRTLDATDGEGYRMKAEDGSNFEWGLKQIRNDMDAYAQEYQAKHGTAPSQPLYNNIIVFTTGLGYCYGDPSNEKCRPVLDRLNAENAAYDEAKAIADKGAHVNFLAMGPSYYNDGRRKDFLTKLAGKAGGNITVIKHNLNGYGTKTSNTLLNYDWYHFQDPRNMDSDWYNKPTNKKDAAQREAIRKACNQFDPSTGPEPTGNPYDLAEQRCNHVRDGKFAETVEDYLFRDKGLEITADAVDENLVFQHPIANTDFEIIGGRKLSTGTDGIVEKPTRGERSLQIVPRPNQEKYALTRLRLPNDKYSPEKLPREANARCVGFSSRKDPFTFAPADATGTNTRGGISLAQADFDKYTYIKCGFYHRLLQESVLRKSVKVSNEQIRFDVLKSKFKVAWSCKDPYTVTDPQQPFVKDSRELVLAKQNTSGPDVTLNTEYTFPDIPIGTKGRDDVHRLPVGATCQVDSSVKYPHRCYGRDQSASCPEPWKKADWDNLMTVQDTLDHSQYFEVKETKPVAPAANGYDYSFTASGEHLTKPEFAAPTEKSILESLTTFTSKKASVKLKVELTNKSNDPAFSSLTKPGKVPVYYNCRYMGDPTRPPEIPESGAAAMPGYVELGAVDVPTNGTDYYELGIKRDPTTHEPILDKAGHTIPTWPVGTHCLFTSLPPKGAPGTATTHPWSVEGFNIIDSYSSNVCASDWKDKGTAEKKCTNNYFWVHSGGQKSITLQQDLVRKNAQITFTKTVSGDAELVGREQTFKENLSCTHNGANIHTGTASFIAQADVPVTVTVPAAAKCSVTEENLTGVPNAITVTKPGQKTFGPITDTTTPVPVTTDTKFTYKTVKKQIQHVSSFDTTVSDQDLQDALQSLTKKVTATCTKPGVAKPEVIETSINGDGTVDLGTLPIGTTCTYATEIPGLPDLTKATGANGAPRYPDANRVIASTTVESPNVTLDGAPAKITTTYKLQTAGNITLHTESGDTLPYASLKSGLPDYYDYTISCKGQSQNKTVRLDRVNGETVLTGNTQIPADTECTLTQVTNDDPRLTRITKMTPSNGYTVKHTSSDTGNPVLTFTSPTANGSLSINIVNDYAVAYTQLTLSTTTDVKTSADTDSAANINVPAKWKKALFIHKTDTGATTGDYKARAKLVCTSGSDKYTIAGDFTVNEDGWRLPNPLTVPVGWSCQIDLKQPRFKIPGADLVGADGKALNADAPSGANFTWNAVGGSGTDATQSGLTGKVVTRAGSAADANSLTLHIPYRMQLGSFNLKKKVGGEGTSMIPGNHQFKVDYSCTLNGVKIPIPAARTIKGKQDVTATLGNDLNDRLADLADQQSIKMGRFEQGEWHPIDALPAGAVCAVSEDSTVAERPHSKWDNYWELNAGFRSREPIVSNCETKGTDLCSYQTATSKAIALVKLPRDAKAKENTFWSKKDNPSGSTNPIVPRNLPENFAGTMVPWNNYTFEKTRVKVNLKIDGNGKRLGEGKAVSLRLYCKPPTLVANGVTIPNAGNAAAIYNTTLKLTPSKADPYTATAVSDVFVPVDYNCVLAEIRPESYDATVDYQLHRVSSDTSTSLTDDIPADATDPLATLKDHLATLFGDIDVNGGTADGVTYAADENLVPAQNEGILKGFRVHPDYVSAQGGEQKYTVFDLTNTYIRPEANLRVSALVDTTTPSTTYQENVGSKLTIAGYQVNYTCTDAYLRNPAQPPATEDTPVTYTGTVNVDSSGHAVQVQRNAETEGILPATATCAFTLKNADTTDPIANYPTLRHRLGADWREDTVTSDPTPSTKKVSAEQFQSEYMDDKYPCPTETDPDQQCSTQKSDLTQYQHAKGVTLDPTGKNQTTITFTNTYLVQKADIGVVAYPQGDRAERLLAKDTTKYPYTYRCTYPTLPVTYPETGSLQYEDTSASPVAVGDAKAAQLARAIVPVDTKCTIVPQPPSADLSSLTNKGLTHLTSLMTPPREQLLDPATGAPRTAPKFSDVLTAEGNVEWSAANRAEVPSAGFPMNAGDDPRVVLHTIYRDKAKVQVRKVDKDFQTAIDTGAKFKIYPVDTNGQPDLNQGIEVSAQTDVNGNTIPGVFTATLAPGGYALEETKSGMGEMLPTYWNFTVSPQNHLDSNRKFDPYTDFGQDLEVKLAGYVSHTGMVAVRTPANDTQPWSIDVAEVSSGYLPKTGGARLWIELTGLLILAGGLALTYRRKTLLKENH